MKVTSLMLAAAAGSASAQSYGLPRGKVFGYSSYSTGLAAFDCSTSSYSCGLDSFQQMQSPNGPPMIYGDHVIYKTVPSYYYNQITVTELSPTLQNLTSRTVDLEKDCDVRTVYRSSSSVYGPSVFLAPSSKGGENGSLVPEVKPLQFQFAAFNTSDNYTEPNRTYFRIYDVDASRDECRSKEVGPSVEEQKKLKLGKGSLRCIARQEVVDNNDTQVVKYTHHALLEHDRNYDGTCAATSYPYSCLRLVSMTSYSNGTKGTTVVKDLASFPSTVQFRTDETPCYYDDSRDSIMILGTTANYNPVILRIDSLSYYSPTITLVRTLDGKTIKPSTSSLMNLGGKFGFVSGTNLLAYSPDGDLVYNKTMSTISSQTLSYVTFQKANTSYAEEGKAAKVAVAK